jgi:selenocysteine-specific elongation factor
MPQTREHMDIIELLGVKKGIVVITKMDLVDEEWLMLIEEEIKEYINNTVLKGAPVIVVSSISGEGIKQLIECIEDLAEDIEERPALGQVRLPIDRVFTISGFGTVITGTLWSGQVSIGDVLELMPVQKPVRIRTLHVHNEKVNTAYAGQRVAVNLQGIDLSEIKRGYLIATTGYLSPSFRVDTRLRLLHSSSKTLRNWNRIRFHLGTEETFGRVVLLDRDDLKPGEESYAQIVMEKPVVCYKGDPFVVRYYSPAITIGGGTIIDSNAVKQKRYKEEVLEELSIKEEGSLYDLILHELTSKPSNITSIKELVKRTGRSEENLKEEILLLLEDNKIVEIKQNHYSSTYGLELIQKKIIDKLREYHRDYSLREGYPKEDMRSRFFPWLDSKTFNSILKQFENQGTLLSQNNQIKLVGHQPMPGKKEEEIIKIITKALEEQLFHPPSLNELRALVNIEEQDFIELITYLTNQKSLVKLSSEVYISTKAIEEGRKQLEDYFTREKELSLATARDIFNTTRKYALPLVEYYDKIRFTRRVGDVRIKM